jgi:LAO/AO transport system kinase
MVTDVHFAHALTHIERGGAFARALRARNWSCFRAGMLVGITGAPGAGKSSLVTALARALRARDILVGILAVDPSSPLIWRVTVR